MYQTGRLNNKKHIAVSLVKICVLFSFIFELFLDLGSVFQDYSYNFYLYLNVYFLLLFIIIWIFLIGINKHFLIFCFYACMFIFLLGQKLFVVMDGGSIDEFLTFKLLKLTGAEYLTFTNLLYFSLLGVFLGYDTTKVKQKIEYKDELTKKRAFSHMHRMRKILRVLYIITFICALIMQIKIVVTKGNLSYTDGYLVNVDINPIIKIGNYMFIGIAFLYLACRPNKFEMLSILFSFILVEGVVQLFIGRRALIAQVILFICWYCISYFKYDEKKLKFKHFLYLIAFALLMIILFYVVETLRGGSNTNNSSLFDILKSFCVSTGGSDSTIANTIHYKEAFPKSGCAYLFAPISDAIKDNVLIRQIISIITGTNITSSAQGLHYLTQHDTFSHWLSYTVSPELYLSGHGMGSSFIAETYVAFGFIGVVIFSYILGKLIKRFKGINKDSGRIYVKALIMFFVYNLFVLPRGSVFASMTDLLYLVFTFAVVKILYNVLFVPTVKSSVGVNRGRVS